MSINKYFKEVFVHSKQPGNCISGLAKYNEYVELIGDCAKLIKTHKTDDRKAATKLLELIDTSEQHVILSVDNSGNELHFLHDNPEQLRCFVNDVEHSHDYCKHGYEEFINQLKSISVKENTGLMSLVAKWPREE